MAGDSVSVSIEFGRSVQADNETINHIVGLTVLSDTDRSISSTELIEAGFKAEKAKAFIATLAPEPRGFISKLKLFASDANNFGPQESDVWNAFFEKDRKVWRVTDPQLHGLGADHVQVGREVETNAFLAFEVYNVEGIRMAEFLISNPRSNRGHFDIHLDPKRKCLEEDFRAHKCQQQPDLLEIDSGVVGSHPECKQSVAAFAASYTCSTRKTGVENPICIGPTLFYTTNNPMGGSLTFGVDGLAFLNGRREGAYNSDFGGYILFDHEKSDFEIFPRTHIVVGASAYYDLTDNDSRGQFEKKMTASNRFSGFQSFRLVDDDSPQIGWKGSPYGTGASTATRRAIGHVGWLDSYGHVMKAAAMMTIEENWSMPAGGIFLNRLGVVEAVATNTGGWGPGFVIRKGKTFDDSLPADPTRRNDPSSHRGSGWYEAPYYTMTVHACVTK